jgi:hypothetical protein
MSSSRHQETDGLSERVNITLQQLLRCLCCYLLLDLTGQTCCLKWNLRTMLSRALGIEHIPFVAYCGFSLEEPPNFLFSMRPSIPVSQDASGRLRLLHELHALVRSVLQLLKDEMQARSEPSTAPHFVT